MELKPITVEPTMVDNLGTRWYLDKGASDYASRRDQRGVALDNVVVWHIEELNGKRTNCVVRYNKVIFEDMDMARIGLFIDKLKLMKFQGEKVE